MQYPRIDVLAGSIQLDLENRKRIEDLCLEKQAELRAVVKATNDRLAEELRPQLVDLIVRIDGGECILQEEINDAMQYTPPGGGRRLVHGFAKYPSNNLSEDISRLQGELEEWDYSPLTKFLSQIDDEFVTDSGIRTAGFPHHGLGRIFTKGKQVKDGNQANAQE